MVPGQLDCLPGAVRVNGAGDLDFSGFCLEILAVGPQRQMSSTVSSVTSAVSGPGVGSGDSCCPLMQSPSHLSWNHQGAVGSP